MGEDLVLQNIQKEIAENDVVLYMRGTPTAPCCGYSASVVRALKELGVSFLGVDVLSDPSVLDGIRRYSNWPDIPQLYVKGSYLGSSDIVKELDESGELEECLTSQGIACHH
jgi:monothiol glutaredoxin